jgi:hypothetical protein
MGAAVVSSRTGKENEDAGSPTKTAMPCSYCARHQLVRRNYVEQTIEHEAPELS